jgi:hypothetical protein
MTAVPGLTLELGLDCKLAREIIELVRDTAFGRSPVAKTRFRRLGVLIRHYALTASCLVCPPNADIGSAFHGWSYHAW